MALTTKIRLNVESTLTGAADLGVSSRAASAAKSLVLQHGTGANQADLLYADTNTIAASATSSLDLAGTLANGLGGTSVFAKLKAIVITAATTNVNNVVLTRPATNGVPIFSAAGDAMPVLPGGLLAWVAPGAGVTVTASTGDMIDFVNSGAGSSVSYDVILIGTSA